jgi:hypothetical protein
MRSNQSKPETTGFPGCGTSAICLLPALGDDSWVPIASEIKVLLD